MASADPEHTRVDMLRAACKELSKQLAHFGEVSRNTPTTQVDWHSIERAYRKVEIRAETCGAHELVLSIKPLMDKAGGLATDLCTDREYLTKLDHSKPEQVSHNQGAYQGNEDLHPTVWSHFTSQVDAGFTNFGTWLEHERQACRDQICEAQILQEQNLEDVIEYLAAWLLPQTCSTSSGSPVGPSTLEDAFGSLLKAIEKHRLTFLYLATPKRRSADDSGWDTLRQDKMPDERIPTDAIDPEGEFLFKYRYAIESFAQEAIGQFGPWDGCKSSVEVDGKLLKLDGGHRPVWEIDATGCPTLEHSSDALIAAAKAVARVDVDRRLAQWIKAACDLAHDTGQSRWYASVLVRWNYVDRLDQLITSIKVAEIDLHGAVSEAAQEMPSAHNITTPSVHAGKESGRDPTSRESDGTPEADMPPEVRKLLDEIEQLSQAERHYILRCTLFQYAQTYHNLLEVVATSPVGWADMELNGWYLQIVAAIRQLLAMPEFSTFPDGFEPVASNLLPGNDLDIEWEDCICPPVMDFVSRAQAFVLAAGPVRPEKQEIIKSVLLTCRTKCEEACQVADRHKRKAKAAFDKVLQRVDKQNPRSSITESEADSPVPKSEVVAPVPAEAPGQKSPMHTHPPESWKTSVPDSETLRNDFAPSSAEPEPPDGPTRSPMDQLLFTEEMPAQEAAVTDSIYNLTESLWRFTLLLTSKYPMPYLTYGEDHCEYEDELRHREPLVSEVLNRVWSYPRLTPSHAESLKARFDALLQRTRDYPQELMEIAKRGKSERRELWLQCRMALSVSDKMIDDEIDRQGGVEGGVFVVHMPDHKPTTLADFVQAIRSRLFTAMHDERHLQARLYEQVMDLVTLLVELNNMIVRPFVAGTEISAPVDTPPANTLRSPADAEADRMTATVHEGSPSSLPHRDNSAIPPSLSTESKSAVVLDRSGAPTSDEIVIGNSTVGIVRTSKNASGNGDGGDAGRPERSRRRKKGQVPPAPSTLPFEIDANAFKVTMGEKALRFTVRQKQQFALLCRMNRRPGYRVQFDDLRQVGDVWDGSQVDDSSIKGAVSRLKKRLRKAKMMPLANAIKTGTFASRQYVIMDLIGVTSKSN